MSGFMRTRCGRQVGGRAWPAVVLVCLLGFSSSIAHGQEEREKLEPKARYRVGLCFEMQGAIRAAERAQLVAELLQLVKLEPMVEDVRQIDYDLRTYGPWPGPGTDLDVICHTLFSFADERNRFTIRVRFYYVREEYNIILPDIEKTDYGRGRLKSRFADLFRANFPVEAVVLQKTGDRLSISRGSDGGVLQNDLFVPLAKSSCWWDVFGQKCFQIVKVDDKSALGTIPKQVRREEVDQYTAAIAQIPLNQLVIRRNHDPAEYLTDENHFSILWSDERQPVSGARIFYALGDPKEQLEWVQGPQLLRNDVALALPRGVPVTLKPVLQRGRDKIEGKPVFIEGWGELSPEKTTLLMDPQYQTVELVIKPADVLVFVKVDGAGVKERPLKLRWGTHQVEVVAAAGGEWFPWADNVSIPVPDGKLEIELQRDFQEEVLAKLRAYYDRGEAAPKDFDAPEVADRTIALIEAVEIMERCAPNHPQFLELRYTVSSVLAKEGYYAEALMALTNYQQSTGMAGDMEETLRIVTRGAFSTSNARMPRKWMWDWFNENPLTSVDRLDLPAMLKLPVRARGRDLSAEDNAKIYRYLLGNLLYHYATGATGRPSYLPEDLDRCLAYMIAFNYMNEHNWPSLAGQPFLNAALGFYSRYYRFKILDTLDPIITKLSQEYEPVRRTYNQLEEAMKQSPGDRGQERLKLRRGKLLLHMNLVQYHPKLAKERARLGAEFLQYAKQLKQSSMYKEISADAKQRIEAMMKEVKDKLSATGGVVVEEAY